mgnify:FL=1
MQPPAGPMSPTTTIPTKTRMAGIEPADPFGNVLSKHAGDHCPTSASERREKTIYKVSASQTEIAHKAIPRLS